MMAGSDQRTRKKAGLAVLIALSMLTGVFVAASVSGEEFATVGTIAESNQAFAVPLEDQRVQFSLEAGDGAGTPAAQFSVYDPQDTFFASFELRGQGDDVEMLADQPGHWVIFVTETRNAELAVAIEDDVEDENASEADLIELEVLDEQRTVADLDGEALDEHLVLRLDQRPAVTFLKVDGEVTNLDGAIQTEKGLVFQVSDATQNETHDGLASSEGDYDVALENLVAGTYEVAATADELDGELVFVYQTYDRGELERHEIPEKRAPPEVPEAPAFQGAQIAELEEGQAGLIDTEDIAELAFRLDNDSEAQLLVYNDENVVTQVVELAPDEDEHDHDRSEEEANSSAMAEKGVTTVELAEPGQHVLYVRHLEGAETITVLLPGADQQDAEQAELLEIEETEVTLTGENSAQEVELAGGLVAIGAHHDQGMSITWERSLTVTGPEGEVLHHEQNLDMLGASMYGQYQVHPEHFSDGLFEIEAESEDLGLFGGDGETTVVLKSFLR